MFLIELILPFFFIASAFISNKLLVMHMYPDVFVFLRMFLSGIFLLVLYCRKKEEYVFAKNNKKNLFIIAIFTTFLPSILRAYALQIISSSRASFWGSLEPFIASIYLYFLYDKRLTFKQFLGCLIAVVGSMFFIYTQHSMDISAKKIFFLADIMQILSIVFGRYGWIKAQELIKLDKLSPMQINAYTFIISGLTALIFSIIKGSFYTIFTIKFNSYIIFLIAYTVICGNMIGYSLYGKALKKYSVTLVSLCGLSVPFFVHILSPFIFNESISIYFFISILFLFIGLYIFNKK